MALDLNDKTTNGNNLTNNNGVTEVTASLPFSGSTSAADFELSSSQYLSATDSGSLSFTGDFTLECWVKLETLPSVAGTAMTLISKDGGGPGDRSYHLGIGTDDKLFAQFWDSSDNNSRFNSTSTIISATDTWFHIAVSFDVSVPSGIIYKDGSSVGVTNAATAATVVNDSATSLFLGARPESPVDQYLDGILDDVRIWNDIRTAGEISSNYNQELIGNEANLVAYYPFEASLKTLGGSFFFFIT